MPSASLCDITVPHKGSINAHNSMYRLRAKLRDILRIVDRHSTGVLSRQKFHMCLQLADLPRPDRRTDDALYGRYYTKNVFRYGEFLESIKYDTSYQSHLMHQWKLALGGPGPKGHRVQPPVSLTPDPQYRGGLPSLHPPSRGPNRAGGSRGLVLPVISRQASRASRASVGSRLGKWEALQTKLQSTDPGGVVPIERLQQALGQMQLVPSSNNRLMDLLQQCDANGRGDIDYTTFITRAQQSEQRGDPVFVPAHGLPNSRQALSRHSKLSSAAGSTSAKARREQLKQSLHAKHRAVLDALQHADRHKTGEIELDNLKNALQNLGVVSVAQLSSGELDSFFGEFENNGMVNYKAFAEKIKREDLKQLEQLSDEALLHQHLK